jgi:hypothetical protein
MIRVSFGVTPTPTNSDERWYSGPSFAKRIGWRELTDQLSQMPGATATLNLSDDIGRTSISLTVIDTRFRITAEDDEFLISAEKVDLPAASWVPLINHVEPVLGKPTN